MSILNKIEQEEIKGQERNLNQGITSIRSQMEVSLMGHLYSLIIDFLKLGENARVLLYNFISYF